MVAVPLLAGCSRQPVETPDPLRTDGTTVGSPVEIGSGLYVLPGGGCNTALFVHAAGVLVVDPKFQATWPDVQAAVRRITNAPITHVVVTHHHDDHAGAVRVLPPGVEVIAQAHAWAELQAMDFVPQPVDGRTAAVRTYERRLDLFDGADRVTLLSPGPAHTGGDTFVVFPRARALHAGDVFPDKVAPIVSLEGGGDGRTYADTIRAVTSQVTGVERVITGHGPVLSWADLVEHADFMAFLTRYVGAEMRMFRDKAAVFNAIVLPPAFADYRRDRLFDTMDEIDRSLRPRWQRVF
jgi:cyclase